MSSQATSDFRRRRKLNLIKVAGNKCNLCGYERSVNALEFHHLVSEDKSYGISAKGTCHNLEQDLDEIKKCILLCANCHREVHDGMFELKELQDKQVFNLEIATKLIEERDQTIYGIKYFCSSCGAEITKYSKSGLCNSCFRAAARKVERPTREELKELIQQYSFTELGRMFDVSDNSIRKWCQSYQLPSRKTDILKVQNWEEI